MAKKIIVLNGSPKRMKSATMQATQAFLKGFQSVKDVSVEIIHIQDLHIEPCKGCLSCWGRTEGECIIKNDDIFPIKEKIEKADYIIESFPLYFFGMPGLMKVFTDRMLSMMLTYRGQVPPDNGDSYHGIRNPKNQKFLIISSCAYADAKLVYDSLKNQYDCICGKNKYQMISCPELKTLIDLNNQARIEKYFNILFDAGKEYALNGVISKEKIEEIETPPFSQKTYEVLLKKFWQSEKEDC